MRRQYDKVRTSSIGDSPIGTPAPNDEETKKGQSGGRETCWPGKSRIQQCRSDPRAAHRRLAEVLAPRDVVVLCVRRTETFAPANVVGGIDDAVAVEVTRYSGDVDRQYAGRVELRRVPLQAVC